MADYEAIKNKPNSELAKIAARSQPGSKNSHVVESILSGRTVDSINNLSAQIENHTETSDKLSKKIFWLNFLIALGTMVLALFSALQFWKEFGN